ncbi:hypothetical protein C1646_664506 [Rhizophagus diaphanus]|nr:hypothetical protein C1646_664506 [Rhizophagus diaphanus] [Rhizophagus sp. MUCL 43196]
MVDINDYNNPRDFDILLPDIDAEDIYEIIPKKLNVKYLSEVPNELDGNITGIIYGPYLRLFFATTIRIKNMIKMVIFLINIGSPTTFISGEVLRSFGIEMADPVNDYIDVNINNRRVQAMMSHSHFENICIIGMSFLNANKVGFHTFYGDYIFYLNFNKEIGEKEMNLWRKKRVLLNEKYCQTFGIEDCQMENIARLLELRLIKNDLIMKCLIVTGRSKQLIMCLMGGSKQKKETKEFHKAIQITFHKCFEILLALIQAQE